MKKGCLLLLFPLLFLVLASTSSAWQGRMGGMGDPYGLISDESDFLINPAGIAKGEGVRFYGDYRFTYTGVSSWDCNLDQFTPAGALTNFYHYNGSGQEYKHNALVGAGFPLGPGRMGIFFTYDAMRGNYDGEEDILGTSNYAEYDLTKDLDNLALRFLYGFPVLGMDAGLELGMAYRNEKQESWINLTNMTAGTQNYILNWLNGPDVQLMPFMIPYDSNYWELLWKAGMEKQFDSLGLNWHLRGGFIVASDNSYHYRYEQPVGVTLVRDADMEGDVAGWRIGSDIWLRYAMKEGLTLPFLVSIDYAAKKRDGDAIGFGTSDGGAAYDYEHQEQSLDLKAGGGIEKKFGDNTLIAAGLYYNYLQGRDDFSVNRVGGQSIFTDYSDFPLHQEHRVIITLAGELELTPVVTLRMGLAPFYGWVRENFATTCTQGGVPTYDFSLNGSHWGIGASLGGTIKFKPITLEPFINFNYRQTKLDGDGDRTNADGTVAELWEMDKSRDEWSIGGGFSVLFDLP